ncbi:MAG: hypothetical protein JW798_10610 [Prolixibacteraceae bacterium]|nr:hypothetical protein [Prolixibacteraceae bacterium]
MKIKFFLIECFLLFLAGCWSPVNLTYESARTVNKGEVELQGNTSGYYSLLSSLVSSSSEINSNNDNFGIKIGYGITDFYTLKARYERITWNFATDYYLFDLSEMKYLNYFEIENKFKFKNANVAIGIPLQYYSFTKVNGINSGYFCVDPRAYFTFINTSNSVELNVVPKVHLIFLEEIIIRPAISIGLGLSDDLDKWAIRPEIGFNGCFSFGVGLNVNIFQLLKIDKSITDN